MIKDRYLTPYVLQDLREKMVMVGGPRQVGKTTLAQHLVAARFRRPVYLNWDNRGDRRAIMDGNWRSDNDLLIFDEIHKYRKWKGLVKGYYDVQKAEHAFLVTGSARLDLYRRGGDSMQGRYHYYRCHPFSVAELAGRRTLPAPFAEIRPETDSSSAGWLDLLEAFGGFPEPLLRQDQRTLRRWHNEKIERLFREDINEQERIRDLQSMKLLSDLLPGKVSSLLSLNNLATDIQASHTAVSSWMNILESYYYHFRVYPFQGKSQTIRALKKEPKLYLWDWSEVENEAARFENLVASHLLKLTHLLNDAEGYKTGLYYLRDRDQREVDFLMTVNAKPWFAVEVKLRDTAVAGTLAYFQERLKIPFAYQVVRTPGVQKSRRNISVISADHFLSALV